MLDFKTIFDSDSSKNIKDFNRTLTNDKWDLITFIIYFQKVEFVFWTSKISCIPLR